MQQKFFDVNICRFLYILTVIKSLVLSDDWVYFILEEWGRELKVAAYTIIARREMLKEYKNISVKHRDLKNLTLNSYRLEALQT